MNLGNLQGSKFLFRIRTTRSSYATYKVLDSKRVWEEVFSKELDKNGNKLWIDAASVASFRRQNEIRVTSFSKSSGTEKLGRVDFART